MSLLLSLSYALSRVGPTLLAAGLWLYQLNQVRGRFAEQSIYFLRAPEIYEKFKALRNSSAPGTPSEKNSAVTLRGGYSSMICETPQSLVNHSTC